MALKATSDDVQDLRKTVEELREQMAVKATSGDVQDLRKRIEQLQADMGNMASAKIVDALSKGIKKYQQHIDKEMNTIPCRVFRAGKSPHGIVSYLNEVVEPAEWDSNCRGGAR